MTEPRRLMQDPRRPALILKMSVEQALQWAFIDECADLSLTDVRDVEDRGFGFGTEYVLLERMRLGGMSIDTSRGKSSPHDDAELIAAALSRLENEPGGRAKAVAVASFARAGICPDWMPGAVPRLVPIAWKAANGKPPRARTEVLRVWHREKTTRHPRNPARTVVRSVKIVEEWCPCTWAPAPSQIAHARAVYSEWRAVLRSVRDELQRMPLRRVVVTSELPPAAPWAGEGPKPFDNSMMY